MGGTGPMVAFPLAPLIKKVVVVNVGGRGTLSHRGAFPSATVTGAERPWASPFGLPPRAP